MRRTFLHRRRLAREGKEILKKIVRVLTGDKGPFRNPLPFRERWSSMWGGVVFQYPGEEAIKKSTKKVGARLKCLPCSADGRKTKLGRGMAAQRGNQGRILIAGLHSCLEVG